MENELDRLKRQIRKLQEQVRKIEESQAKCQHDWGDIKYDQEKRRTGTTELVWQGSDYYYRGVDTGYENVDRWSRTCKKCGKIEYTYEIEEVAVKTISRPKF